MKDCKIRPPKLLSREVKGIIGIWGLEIFIIDKSRSSISVKFLYSHSQNCNGSLSKMNVMSDKIVRKRFLFVNEKHKRECFLETKVPDRHTYKLGGSGKKLIMFFVSLGKACWHC